MSQAAAIDSSMPSNAESAFSAGVVGNENL
jgi:hypothetical protein